jgi:hypothetical protein
LAYFRKDGSLEGRWGWLEVLRRAQDEDIATYKNSDQLEWGHFGALWPQCEAGTWCGAASASFSRNESGEILVGHMAHSEFALLGDEYGLYERGCLGTYSYYASFTTPARMVHYHYKYDWGRVDKEDIALDIGGILLSVAEGVPVYNYAAMRTGWMLDAYSINKDLAKLDQMIHPGPLEIVATAGELGVDAFGALPVAGVAGDLTGLVVSIGGGIYRTP